MSVYRSQTGNTGQKVEKKGIFIAALLSLVTGLHHEGIANIAIQAILAMCNVTGWHGCIFTLVYLLISSSYTNTYHIIVLLFWYYHNFYILLLLQCIIIIIIRPIIYSNRRHG